ncbi:unnamed protein product, partial [Ectocarpus sp. 12 AP-2014]
GRHATRDTAVAACLRHPTKLAAASTKTVRRKGSSSMLTRSIAAARARRRRPRPQGIAREIATTTAAVAPRTIMVLRIVLGSAAAVLGGGRSGSRALAAASTTPAGPTTAASSFFRARGGVASSTESRAALAFVNSWGPTVPLQQQQQQQQQRRAQHQQRLSTVQQEHDRPRRPAAGAGGVPLGGTSSSSGRRQQRRGGGGGGSLRLSSTAAGGPEGEGKGFWTEDEEVVGFEEPPSSTLFRERGTGGVGAPPPAAWDGDAADAGEAGFLQEEDDETEWMAGQEVDPEAEAIFFGDRVPFSDLGLSPALCGHLEALGIGDSTAVQAAAVPGILSGEDMIVGAETGSGKTLAYLLPIVERVLRGQAVAKDLPDELLGNARGWPMFPDVVVLVPNKELCDQVHSVLKGILKALNADGITGVTAAAKYGSSYEYPFSPNKPAPSILVCTPSFLHKYTNMKAIPLFCKATTLVLDEADMLMEGSYRKQLDDILVAFRRADRVMVEEGSVVDGGVRKRGIDKTQYVLAAATLPTYGLKSVDQYIKRAFPSARKIQQVHMHRHHPAIQQNFVEVGGQVFDKIQAVIDLLRDTVSETDTSRTMVFTNTAASCK